MVEFSVLRSRSLANGRSPPHQRRTSRVHPDELAHRGTAPPSAKVRRTQPAELAHCPPESCRYPPSRRPRRDRHTLGQQFPSAGLQVFLLVTDVGPRPSEIAECSVDATFGHHDVEVFGVPPGGGQRKRFSCLIPVLSCAWRKRRAQSERMSRPTTGRPVVPCFPDQLKYPLADRASGDKRCGCTGRSWGRGCCCPKRFNRIPLSSVRVGIDRFHRVRQLGAHKVLLDMWGVCWARGSGPV